MSNRKKKKTPGLIATVHFDRKTGEGYTYQKNAQSMREYRQQVKTYRGDVRNSNRRAAQQLEDYNNYVQQASNKFNDEALRQSVESKINGMRGRSAATGITKVVDPLNHANDAQLSDIQTVNGMKQIVLPEPAKADDSPLTWVLESLGSAYMHVNHDLTHPFTALFLGTNPNYQANHGGGFNWSQAWHDTSAKDFRSLKPKNLDGGDAISFGQAAVSNPLAIAASKIGTVVGMGSGIKDLENIAAASNNEERSKAVAFGGSLVGDPTDPAFQEKQKMAAKKAPHFLGMALDPYSVASGIEDTAQQSVGDGLALLTGALKGARAAARITPEVRAGILSNKSVVQKTEENLAKMDNMFTAGRDGVSDNPLSRMSEFISKKAQEGKNGNRLAVAEYLKRKDVNLPDGVAEQLVQTKGDREWIDTMILASAGHQPSIAKLKAGRPADHAQFVSRSESTKAQLVANRVYLPGGSIPEDMVAVGSKGGADGGTLIGNYKGAKAEGASGFGNAGPTRYMRDSTSGKLVPVVPEPDLFWGKIRNKAADITHIDRLAEAPKDPVMSVPKVGDNFLTDTGKAYHADTQFAPEFSRLLREDPAFRDGYIRARANIEPDLAQSLHLGTNAELSVIGKGLKGKFGSKVPGWWRLQSKTSEKMASGMARNTFRFAGDHTGNLLGGKDSTYGTVEYHQGGKFDYPIAVQRWSLREKPKGILIHEGVGIDDTIPEVKAVMNSVPSLRTAEDAMWKDEWLSRFARNLHSPDGLKATKEAFEKEMVQRIASKHAPRFLEKQGLKEGDKGYEQAYQAFVDDKVHGAEILHSQQGDAVRQYVNDGGFMWDTQSNGMHLSPQLANQLETGTPLLPMKLVDEQMAEAVKGDGTWVTKSLHKTGDTAYALNEGFQAVWRPLTLLRAAYPVRNTIEGFSRVLAFVGAHAVMNQMADTAGSAATNVGRSVLRKTRISKATEAVTADATAVANRRTIFEAAKRELDDMAIGSPEHIAHAADLYDIERALKAEQAQLTKSETKLTKASSWKHMGQSEGDPFYGKVGDAAWLRAGNQATWDRMALSTTDARQVKMRDRVQINNTKVTLDDGIDTYTSSMNDLINHVLVDNRVTQMRLDPSVTATDFQQWFLKHPDARNELMNHQALGLDVFNPDSLKAWFEDGRANLLETIPDESLRESIRTATGPIGAGRIRSFVEQYKDTLPPINGNKIVAQHGIKRSGRRWMKDFVGKMFHAVGSMPEQNLVRGPYYQARWSEYLDLAARTLGKDATRDDWGRAYMEAHRYATRKMNKDLYTIVRQKNLTGLVEHVSPFWTAQINTLATWPRILWENPKAIAGIAKAYVRAREGGFVDDQGWFHPVPGLKIGDGPGALDIKIPFSNVLSVFAGHLNQETSSMVALATGDDSEKPGFLSQMISSIFPSPGPIMSAAGSLEQNHEMLRGLGVSDAILDPIHRWLNPYGPSSDLRIWDKLVPGYVRTTIDALDTNSDAARTTQVQILGVETWKYQHGLRKDMPTPEEIVSKGQKIMLALALGQWSMPGSPRKVSPLQPMLDQWYKMQRLYGTTEAHARWNDMYGDDFLALTSVTGTEKVTGLQPNNASWRMLKDHPDLVKKIVDVSGDPTTIQLLMGNQGYAQTPDNEYWAARRNMQHYKPPGLDTTAITGKTPEQMLAEYRLADQWRGYRDTIKLPTDAVKTLLTKQFGSWDKVPKGLKADQTKYRNDQLKKFGKANPEWAAEWKKGPQKGRLAIKTLTTITSDAKFMKQAGNDPYWSSVKDFLEARKAAKAAVRGGVPKYGASTPKQAIKAIEASSAAKGYHFSAASTAKFEQGIRDKAHKPGTELWKQWQLAKYESTVDRLKRKNVRFADMHDRWFALEGFDPNRFS